MFRERFPALTRILEFLSNSPITQAPRWAMVILSSKTNRIIPRLGIGAFSGREWFSGTDQHAFDRDKCVKQSYLELEGRRLPVAR